MLCSMCVYYINVFCLSFVSETKPLHGVLLYVQLKRRQWISVNVFRALLNSLQSVASSLNERQSVVAYVSKLAVILVKVKLLVQSYWLIHSPKGLQNSKLFVIFSFFAGVFLFKVNTIMSENCLWKDSLTLQCYFSTGKYLMGSCVWFRLTLCFGQRFVYVLQSLSYCIQDLTTVCISSFSFERNSHSQISYYCFAQSQ